MKKGDLIETKVRDQAENQSGDRVGQQIGCPDLARAHSGIRDPIAGPISDLVWGPIGRERAHQHMIQKGLR